MEMLDLVIAIGCFAFLMTVVAVACCCRVVDLEAKLRVALHAARRFDRQITRMEDGLKGRESTPQG